MESSRTYECMCLLDNREVRKGWQPLKDAVAGVFAKHGAEVLSSRRWDERRLGYPVRGQLRGTYLLVYFKGDPQSLPAIRRDLQFLEPVMRFLTKVCEEVPAEAYEPEAEFDINAIPEEDAPPASPEPEPEPEKAKKEEPGSSDGESAEKAEGEGDGAEASSESENSNESDENAEPQAKTEA